MEKERYMVIHNGRTIHRFKCLAEALYYATIHSHGNYEFCIVVDTEKDEVVNKWSY